MIGREQNHIETPESLLEKGKDPGLGVRKLHEEGITGEGVTVGIIDQKLLTTHNEYKDSIFSYEEVGEQDYEPQMHASGVASILTGEECGIAPGSKLIYEAVPCGRDFLWYTEALSRILKHNEEDANNPVRVVSCSIGFSEDSKDTGIQEWKEVLKDAEQKGVIVIHPSMRGIDFLGGGMPTDKNNIEEFEEASWLRGSKKENTESIRIPSDYRATASERGDDEYVYREENGISWSVPYLAGISALALQINPRLTEQQIFKGIKATCQTNTKGLKIINPPAFIEWVRNLG